MSWYLSPVPKTISKGDFLKTHTLTQKKRKQNSKLYCLERWLDRWLYFKIGMVRIHWWICKTLLQFLLPIIYHFFVRSNPEHHHYFSSIRRPYCQFIGWNMTCEHSVLFIKKCLANGVLIDFLDSNCISITKYFLRHF